MKFSLLVATLFTFVAVSLARPAPSYVTIDDLVERALGDLEVLEARDWVDLYIRTGPFHPDGKTTKVATNAKTFINEAKNGGKLSNAAAPGSSAKTTHQNNAFHLDRQQPTNANGQRKVAVQLNSVRKGDPSTISQVAIHGNARPSDNKVAKKLNYSLKSGKETHINHPDSKAAKNSAANQQAQVNKQSRISAAQRAGNSRAAAGQYKKGVKRATSYSVY